MADWLKKFNNKMIKSQRKMLLLVNNVAFHSYLKLKNVVLVFSPLNMTFHCQPLNQGIVQQFKKFYRKQLL